MALAPGLKRVDHRTQTLANLRQGVLNPRRHLGIDLADHEIVVLERAKLLGQHALGNAWHPPAQLAKALRAVLQMEQNYALPLAVDQVERRLDCAAGPMREIPPFHERFPEGFLEVLPI